LLATYCHHRGPSDSSSGVLMGLSWCDYCRIARFLSAVGLTVRYFEFTIPKFPAYKLVEINRITTQNPPVEPGFAGLNSAFKRLYSFASEWHYSPCACIRCL